MRLPQTCRATRPDTLRQARNTVFQRQDQIRLQWKLREDFAKSACIDILKWILLTIQKAHAQRELVRGASLSKQIQLTSEEPSDVANVAVDDSECEDCHLLISRDSTHCPHCGRPQLFPNVRYALRESEIRKLNERYELAARECIDRNCEEVLNNFQEKCAESRAVFGCRLLMLFRQVSSGTDVFETFHDTERLMIRSSRPSDHDWLKLRPQTESELLGSGKHLDKLHYACVSIDGRGIVESCVLE